MSRSYELDKSDDWARRPGESLVAYYNRKLAMRGRHDIEWVQTADGAMRLREKTTSQSKLEF